MNDMNRPLKHFTKAGDEYRKIERPLQNLIFIKYGVPTGKPMCIEIVDKLMYQAERQQLMGSKLNKNEKAADVLIWERSFYQNKFSYLTRFNELCRLEDKIKVPELTF
jgi:hypothetical protein